MIKLSLRESASKVDDQESLSEFISELSQDYMNNRDRWENVELGDFLNAMAAWVEAMDAYYQNTEQPFDKELPSWKNFADILLAATVYE